MQTKINETGRSMVEMLGVLAVIGVLSVGGIMGYKFAMVKYAANATINDVNLRSTTLLQQNESNKKLSLGEFDEISTMGYPFTPINEDLVDNKFILLEFSDVPKDVCNVVQQDIAQQTNVEKVLVNNDINGCLLDKNTIGVYFQAPNILVEENEEDIECPGRQVAINGKCGCRIGYMFNDTCVASCPSNSTFSDDLKSCVCDAGYVMQGTSCRTGCAAKMQLTDDGTRCVCSNAGEYLSYSGSCNSCNGGESDGFNCISCASGYYLNKENGYTYCAYCPSGATCAGGTETFVCKEGYKRVNTNCYINDCPSNSSFDEETQQCICNEGYYFSGSTCYSCKGGESDGFKCLYCGEGSYLDISGACYSCPTNSISCTSSYDFICNEGYYASYSSCNSCNGGTVSTDGKSCATCASGYYKNGSGCSSCNGGTSDGENCLSCLEGYYLYSSGTSTYCRSCIANSTCTSATDYTCKEGYYNTGSKCSLCSSIRNHETCLQDGTITCKTGYYRKSKFTCTSCGNGFTSDGIVCTCGTGYYRDSNGGCTKCPSSAASCDATGFTCPSGYYKTWSSCESCYGGTVSADGESCASCVGNYFLFGGFSCSPCGAGSTANADHTGCVCSGDAARWNQFYNYCCPAGTTASGDFCRKPDGTCVDEYGNTVSWC